MEILNGRIKYLSLKNFMCHDNFEMNFNERINFLCGPNGSGKSAIMSAIQVVLGGKATFTSRASSFKEFIKDGKKSAEIVIHLKNDFDLGYKQEIYGTFIEIQKIFNSNGHTSNKIYNSKKNLISSKAKDISNLCDIFNIQVQNPILMLTQDMSRTFFHNTTPKKLYQVVNQALRMEDILKIFSHSRETLTKINENLHDQNKLLEKQYESLKLLEAQINKFQHLSTIWQNMEAMKNELHLFEYHQICNEIQKIKETILCDEKELESLRLKYSEIEALSENNSNKLSKILVKIKSYKDHSSKYKSDIDNQTIESEELKMSIKSYKPELSTIAHQIKTLTTEKSDLEYALQQFNENEALFDSEPLQDNISMISASVEKEAMEKVKQIEIKKVKTQIRELKEILSGKRSMLNTQQMDLGNLDNSIKLETEQAQKLCSQLAYLEDDRRKKNYEIRDINNAQRDVTQLYGEWMPALLKAIESAYDQNQFIKKPKGPIGLYIKVKNDRASLALESCLLRVLRNFICDNQKDSFVLRKLLEKYCPPNFTPTVSIFKYTDKRYDIDRFLCTYNGAYSFTDLIDITDPDAFNYIMDQRRIESILFWEDNEDIAVVFSDERKRPKNCSEALAFNGDVFMYRGGSLSCYPSNFSRSKYLSSQGDKKELLRQYESELRQLDGEIKEINIKKGQFAKSIQDYKVMKTKIESHITTLKHQIYQIEKDDTKAQHNLNGLLYANEEDRQNASSNVIEEEINSRVLPPQQIEKFTVEIEECEKKLGKLRDRNSRIESLIEEKTQKIQSCNEIIEKARQELSDINTEFLNIKTYHENVRQFKLEMVGLSRRLEEGKSALEISKDNLDTKEKIFQDKFSETHESYMEQTQQLDNVLPPLNTLVSRGSRKKKSYRDKEEITNDIERLKREIISFERQLEDISLDNCKIEHETLKRKIESYRNECIKFEKCHKIVSKALKVHVKGYDLFKAKVHERICGFFEKNMAMRNFETRIQIDTKSEEIQIQVKPDRSKEFCNDLKALSGGERSYTSISFLLALWNCLRTPFLCIDEFDVFMDIVNREIGKTLIIANARATNNAQMIILTPLDIGNIDEADDISVWKLKPPSRSKI